MYIVAGLGNPGDAYQGTLHNVGFDVLDVLADRFGGSWRRSLKVQGRTARVRFPGGQPVLLLKPQTFMNASGRSVAAAVRYFGCELTELVVVFDDADLEPGQIRLRGSGGSGGHRGMASIIEALGADMFPRVRIGIGRSDAEGLIGHVLARTPESMLPAIERATQRAAEAVACLVREGLDRAMNRFNSRGEAVAAQTGTDGIERNESQEHGAKPPRRREEGSNPC